jgi:DNA-binding NarL/FixJ family response regulator
MRVPVKQLTSAQSQVGQEPLDLRSGTRIVLADAEPVFLEGLRSVCARAGFAVAGVVADERELESFLKRVQVDVAVIGVLVGALGSFEAVRLIAQISPGVRALLLTSLLDERRVSSAWMAGARGLAPRWVSEDELTCAIHQLAAGGTYICGSQRTYLSRSGINQTTVNPLTSRESEVLALIADGKSGKQVAALLNIAPKTAEHHRSHLCKKLGVWTTAHLVRSAIRLGLVVP